jgi:hypothetical protein
VIPPGYESFAVRGAIVVALSAHAEAIRTAMAQGTLHGYAAASERARPLAGRAIAWATTLADGSRVVVRHSRHGGRLAALTGDIFLRPTRAPGELARSLALVAAGVLTPEVVAYAVYPAFGPLARADVVTRFVDGLDFPGAWRGATDDARRNLLLAATAVLLDSLRRAGAEHPDLNLKNILLTSGGEPVAHVLDVDRVRFGVPGADLIAKRNLARLNRSARKLRARDGLPVGERHLEALARLVQLAASK